MKVEIVQRSLFCWSCCETTSNWRRYKTTQKLRDTHCDCCRKHRRKTKGMKVRDPAPAEYMTSHLNFLRVLIVNNV